MRLSWYGTAAIMLEHDGYRLMFDPFLGMPLEEKPFRREKTAAKFRTADAVIVTHGHFDHIHDIPYLYNNSDIEIYASVTPCSTMLKNGAENRRLNLINPGDSITLGGMKITAYQGRHCRFDFGVVKKTIFKPDAVRHPLKLIELLMTNKRYPENGETLFYEIEADGKRIQLMGSMGMDEDTSYPIGADALVLPFQGTGDPGKTVLPYVHRLAPKRIFLDHYDDAFPPMSSQIETAGFVTDMHREGIPAVAMEYGKTYDI